MRVLEARFHPQRRQQPDFVMLLSKLRYLVGVTGPDSFERLQRLRSDYWSFVPIAAEETPAPATGSDQLGR